MTPGRRLFGILFLWRLCALCSVGTGILSLFSCVSTSAYDAPDFGYSGLGNQDSLLSIAALNTEYIKDIYSRDFLYSRLAEEYLRSGQNQFAREVLRRGTKIARNLAAPEIRQQLLIELAKYYIRANDLGTATALLQESLDLILNIDKDAVRGPSLQALIEVCFTIPESAKDILRSAIDYVYVLDDPVLRVQLLTDLGKKYQDINIRNRANGLVQQAIAAAASITNPWSKAEALTRIAGRFKAEDDAAAFADYSSQAIQELNSVDVVAMSLGDAQSLQQTLSNLVNLGYDREVSAIAGRIPGVQIRVSAMLSLFDRYLALKSSLQARLIVQRISKDIEDNGEPDFIVSTLVRLAESYAQAGISADATTYLGAALGYLNNSASANASQYLSRIAAVYVQLKRPAEAYKTATTITDAYVASQALLKIDGGSGSDENLSKKSILDRAKDYAFRASYLKESALGAVALNQMRAGYFEEGLNILADLQDPFIVGSILVDANAAHPDTTWTAGERKALEKIRSKWLRASL